jgi:hypothetical protein
MLLSRSIAMQTIVFIICVIIILKCLPFLTAAMYFAPEAMAKLGFAAAFFLAIGLIDK